MEDLLKDVLHHPGEGLEGIAIAIRTALVYAFSIAFVRLGKKRFFSENTAFDIIMGVMLGSVLARTINGSAKPIPTFIAAFVLVAMHWILSWLAYRSHSVGKVVKGSSNELIRDGELLEDSLAKHHISEREIRGAMRLALSHEDISQVKVATLERNGEISFVTSEPKVVEVKVEAGVQTIRLELT